jgi:hypothetical protein
MPRECGCTPGECGCMPGERGCTPGELGRMPGECLADDEVHLLNAWRMRANACQTRVNAWGKGCMPGEFRIRLANEGVRQGAWCCMVLHGEAWHPSSVLVRPHSPSTPLLSPQAYSSNLAAAVMPHDVACRMVSHGVTWCPMVSHGGACCCMVSHGEAWHSSFTFDHPCFPSSILKHTQATWLQLQCHMLLHGATWCRMVSHGIAWCHMVVHGVVWCRMVKHGIPRLPSFALDHP